MFAAANPSCRRSRANTTPWAAAALSLVFLSNPLRAQSIPVGEVVEAPTLTVAGQRVTPEAGPVSVVDLQFAPVALATTDALTERTANFDVADGGARGFGDVYSLRGMVNTPFFGDPAVAVYLDDVPLPRAFMYPNELFAWDRAEVCRGPAVNTMFGRVGPAGVVRLSSARPTDELPGEVRASYGSYDSRAVAARVRSSTPGGVFLDASAAYAARDGYILNTQLGERVDDRESLAGRLRGDWAATEQFSLSGQVYAMRARDGAQPLVPLGGPLFEVSRGREGETDVDNFGGALTAALELPAARLSATTAFSRWDLSPYSNRLVLPPALDSMVALHERSWSEEIRLSADPEQQPLGWAAGLYWNDQDTRGDADRELVGLFPIEISSYTLDRETLAGFAEATWRPAEGWSVTPGLRVEQSRARMDRREVVPTVDQFNASRESTALLPSLAIAREFSPRTRAALIAGTGYKPGGFSAFTSRSDLAPFGPERTRSLEAALTHRTADEKLAATVRAFWYSISGYQIERSFTATDYLVVNAARARSWGGELELTWRPAERWTMAATVGALQSTLREFVDPFTGDNHAGRRTPYAPEYDASLGVHYRTPEGWFASAELSATGRTFYDEAETAAFSQGAYVLIDAQAGYASDRFRVAVYGENLADKGYYSAITPGVGHGTPGAPITAGVEAAWRF